MRRGAEVLLSVAVVSSVTGAATCEEYAPTQSSDISTRDMRLAFDVLADTSSAYVEVRLDGPGGLVRLAPGDTLSVSPGGGPPLAFERGSGGLYTALAPPGAAELSLVLDRTPPGESVRVELAVPAATALSVPPTFSRADVLTIEWEAESRPVQELLLSIEGECLQRIERSLGADPGRYTFQAADFPPSEETCAVIVSLTRTVVLQPDSDLLEASGRATRVTQASLESAP